MLQSFLANLSPPQAVVIGALIAAAAAFTSNVLSGVLRDFVSKSWSEGRDRRKSGEEIFQKYAEPLASGATSLFWRLKETLAGDGRGLFLVSVEPRTDFEKYKLLSTYYRLAAVLGCIRALRREFSYYRTFGTARIRHLDEAMSHFESSLADGHHVEIQRLRGVLKIYGFSTAIDPNLELRVATKLEQMIKSYLVRLPAQEAIELPLDHQDRLCTQIAVMIGTELELPTGPELVAQTKPDILRQIAIREAWVFRDWQSAIGDMMIREAEFSQKTFEIIGYGDFENMAAHPSPDQFRNLCRLTSLFEGLELETPTPFDARGETLEKIHQANARLIVALSKDKLSSSFVSRQTLIKAYNCLAQQ